MEIKGIYQVDAWKPELNTKSLDLAMIMARRQGFDETNLSAIIEAALRAFATPQEIEEWMQNNANP